MAYILSPDNISGMTLSNEDGNIFYKDINDALINYSMPIRDGLELFVFYPSNKCENITEHNKLYEIKDDVNVSCFGKIKLNLVLEEDNYYYEWEWIEKLPVNISETTQYINEASSSKISKKTRTDIEYLIYEVLDALDKTKQNSSFYKEKFSQMDDVQFYKFLQRPYPVILHMVAFEIEPVMKDIEKAAKVLGIPLIERIALPYFAKDINGNPVWTKPCYVIYTHLDRVQQMLAKKNKYSDDISRRDVSGRLVTDSKGAPMSDREFECLSVMGLDNTIIEFCKPKADAINSKNLMHAAINATGDVSLHEIELNQADSISKNLMSAYLIGCHIESNLVNKNNYTPYSIQEKQKRVQREI